MKRAILISVLAAFALLASELSALYFVLRLDLKPAFIPCQTSVRISDSSDTQSLTPSRAALISLGETTLAFRQPIRFGVS